MSNELTIITPTNIEESERLSLTLAKSSLLPEALRQKPADVLATVLAGAELGLPPMTAIRGIAIIKGKPTLAADTMGALVKRRREVCEYLQLVESTPTKATYRTKRVGDPEPTTMTFTIEDAQRAGLNGDNWKKYPSAMLRARCLAAICRAVYPDLCLGLYDPDEVGAETPKESAKPEPVEIGSRRTNELKAALKRNLGVEDAQLVEAPKVEVLADEPPPPSDDDAPPAEEESTFVPPTVPFGKNKGTPISSLTLKQLEWYADTARKELADPAKQRFHGSTAHWLAVVEAEQRSRAQ